MKRQLVVCLLAFISSAQSSRPELVLQTGHAFGVTRYAITRDGELMATAGGMLDQTVRLWDLKAGRELRSWPCACQEGTVAFSADGRLLALQSTQEQVSVLVVDNGETLKTLTIPRAEVTALTFSPDGLVLAIGGQAPGDQWLRLFHLAGDESRDVSTGADVAGAEFVSDGRLFWIEGNTVRVLDAGSAAPQTLATLGGAATAMSVTGDGGLIAVASYTGPNTDPDAWETEVGLWNTRTGERVWRSAEPRSDRSFVALSPDGARLAAAGEVDDVIVYSAPDWKASPEIEGSRPLFLLDGRLAVITYTGVEFVDPRSGTREVLDTSTAAPVQMAQFTSDGRYLVAGGAGVALLWDVASGQPLQRWGAQGFDDAAPPVALSPNAMIGVIPGPQRELQVVDLPSGHVRATIDTNAAQFSPGAGIALSSNGRWVADGRVRHAPEGFALVLSDAESGKRIGAFFLDAPVTAIAFSPDSSRLAVADDAGIVRLWATDTWTAIARIETGAPAKAVAFAGDALVAVVGGSLRVYDSTGAPVTRLPEDSDVVLAIGLSADGRVLASAGTGPAITLWDTTTWQRLGLLEGHRGLVRSVTFSPDGKWLLSASEDGTLRLWNLPDRREALSLITASRSLDWMAVTPDGLFDGSPGGWNLVRWRFSQRTRDVLPVEAFFADYYRPGLLSDVLAGRAPVAARDLASRDRRLPAVALTIVSSDATIARVRIAAEEAAGASGGGVRDVRLFRNGVLVKTWRGAQAGGSAVLETDIALADGANALAAYAFNADNVKSETTRAAVHGKQTERGKLYAVVAGVDAYQDRTLNLRYAVADAQSFAEAMTRTVAPALDRDPVVILLRDRRATTANLKAALEVLGSGRRAPVEIPELRLLAKATPRDVVVIFFAGHGAAHEDRFFLLPHDATPKMLQTGVSGEDLQGLIEQVDAAAVLMVIDSCQSGQLLEAADARQGPLNTKGLAQLAYDKGMYVLAASQSYQAALETSQLGHGLLTYALVNDGLDALKADGEPPDGRIGPREWLEYAVKRVPELSLDSGAARSPKLATRTASPSAPQIPRAFIRRDADDTAITVRRAQ